MNAFYLIFALLSFLCISAEKERRDQTVFFRPILAHVFSSVCSSEISRLSEFHPGNFLKKICTTKQQIFFKVKMRIVQFNAGTCS